MAFVNDGLHVSAVFDRNGDNLAGCFDLDPMNGDMGGRFEPVGGLRDVAERLIGDGLSFDGSIGPDAE
jgi:hypothetical protein